MIYTVTLNPSIDYVVEVNELTAGEIMRTKAEDLIFGGKGINVSSMLAQLGMKSCALGFIAGFTGDALDVYKRQEEKSWFFTAKNRRPLRKLQS